MIKRTLTAAFAALFSVWLGMGLCAQTAIADDAQADSAKSDATAVTGEDDEFFESCKPAGLATQTFEPLNKRNSKFLSVRIKGKFETPGPGYILLWRKDQMPSLSATAAMELKILRPLNAYIEGVKEFDATLDKTVVVSPETTTLRIHVVRDFDDDMTFYCKIKPVSMRARNEMDLE